MAEADIDIEADARDRSLPDDLKDLAAGAKAFAFAEVAFQKTRAAFVGSELKAIAVLFVAALVLVFFALEALVFGILLALAPLITAWGATAVVCGVLALTAYICMRWGSRRWRRMTTAMASD